MSTPINREDIRKGDKIMSTFTEEFIAKSDYVAYETGFTYELIERPVVLQTEPGLYLDKHEDVWRLTAPNNRWFCLADMKYDYRETEFAPFTLLRPVAEVAAEVLAEVQLEMSSSADYWQADLAKIRARYAAN